METFNEYSKYYNLLYSGKDYAEEVEYIDSCIKRYRGSQGAEHNKTSVLDLGCGTGKHLFHFRQKQYEVCGIDISSRMIESAKQTNPDIDFHCGDIAGFNLERTFDIITSLFHVISYQISNERLLSTFRSAQKHLNTGGLFIFDCWYGPGVLSDKPVTRIKRLSDASVDVLRIAEPTMYPNENIVDVDYTIITTQKLNGQCTSFKEKHRMRYLFKPEVENMLENSGFKLLNFYQFLTDKEPDFNSWYVIFIAEKKQ